MGPSRLGPGCAETCPVGQGLRVSSWGWWVGWFLPQIRGTCSHQGHGKGLSFGCGLTGRLCIWGQLQVSTAVGHYPQTQ